MNGQLSPREIPTRIEPTRLDAPTEAIADLVAELCAATATLGRALHSRTAANLADIVRIMNSYYSNLIEGHHTRPKDIASALTGEVSADAERRSLLKEAVAHVRVQQNIDTLAATGELPDPTSCQFTKYLHREFYNGAPSDYLTIAHAGRSFKMQPGSWRSVPDHDVSVGRHIPPSSERVSAFMAYFEERFKRSNLTGRTAKVTALAVAHHRFNYIHPFPDGNGRVSRLMTHAMGYDAGIAAHGLWSVSRGMARGLKSRDEYKQMMDHADTPRQGDYDGRGNLSQSALIEFTEWFLKVALDQVSFMSSLFDIETLALRLQKYVQRSDSLKPEATRLLEEALVRGEVERGTVPRIVGLPERSARRVANSLEELGLLASDTPKGPLSLRFPAEAYEILFPNLFPA